MDRIMGIDMIDESMHGLFKFFPRQNEKSKP